MGYSLGPVSIVGFNIVGLSSQSQLYLKKLSWNGATTAPPAASSFQPLLQPRRARVSAGVATALVTPDVAEAVMLTPSLKNFLLSVVSGGVVLVAIVGAVSNFDPLKRT
jgi:hypothetical protein